jgi:hypothetical protein
MTTMASAHGRSGRRGGIAERVAPPPFRPDSYLTDERELYCVADVLEDGFVLLENALTGDVTLHGGEELSRIGLRLVEPAT